MVALTYKSLSNGLGQGLGTTRQTTHSAIITSFKMGSWGCMTKMDSFGLQRRGRPPKKSVKISKPCPATGAWSCLLVSPALGLMFAPKAGRETRELVRRKSRDYTSTIRDKIRRRFFLPLLT